MRNTAQAKREIWKIEEHETDKISSISKGVIP